MNRRRVLSGLSLALLVSAAVLWLRREPGGGAGVISAVDQGPATLSQSPPTAAVSASPAVALPSGVAAKLSESNKRDVGKVLQAFGAPIEFYGKVIDERGTGIRNARIYYSVADRYFGDSSKYTGSSNENGLFSISGIRGAGVYVEVSKEGYYRVADKSYGSFGYGVPSDMHPPSKASPAVFILRKMGEGAPLVKVSERPVKMPKNGSAVEIALKTGRAVPTGQGDLRIECWAQDDKKDTQRRYSWHCHISVPRGGLAVREGEYNFEAPLDGYQEYDDIAPPAERWSGSAERQYFVKTASNHFARVNLRIHPGGEHFFVVGSYFNPQAGSRNLEFDPTKEIKTP